MGSVGCAVLIEGMVGIAMVSDNDCAIAMGLGCLHNLLNTLVDVSTFWIAVYYAGVAHHVAH